MEEQSNIKEAGTYLAEQLEKSPKLKWIVSVALRDVVDNVGGYIHAREALRKLNGVPYNAQDIECISDSRVSPTFPVIDPRQILQRNGIWYEPCECPVMMSYVDNLNGIPMMLGGAVAPTWNWLHASERYEYLGKVVPQVDILVRKALDFYEKERHCDHAHNRKDWDKLKTSEYLTDSEILRKAVTSARKNLESIFADHQANIDMQEEIEKEIGNTIPKEKARWYTLGRGPTKESHYAFMTEAIRKLYAPLVSEPIPGEEKPYAFRYVDKNYLLSLM
jgi:hypothetical protein